MVVFITLLLALLVSTQKTSHSENINHLLRIFNGLLLNAMSLLLVPLTRQLKFGILVTRNAPLLVFMHQILMSTSLHGTKRLLIYWQVVMTMVFSVFGIFVPSRVVLLNLH